MNTYHQFTDIELVKAYQYTQNPEAFGELYHRYYRNVFYYCAKVLKNREKAGDLTQDVFVKAAAGLGQLKKATSFVKWLFQIAHNDCIDLLKQQKKITINPLKENCCATEETDGSSPAQVKERQFQQLRRALDRIPPSDKKLLIEKYWYDKSIAELMETYGVSESAVKMRLARSRKKVKRLYEKLSI